MRGVPLTPDGATVSAGLLEALEAPRIGIPAGENGAADDHAEPFEQPLGKRPVLRRDHEEVRAFGDCLRRALGVLA